MERADDGRVRAPRVGVNRRLRDASKRQLRRLFELGQHVGLDILPRHFYSSVPDIRALRRREGWKRAYSMRGVGGSDLDGQLAVLREWLSQDRRPSLRGAEWQRACAEHGEPGYGPIEAEVLWAFVAARRPPRVVQVGAGVSTAVLLAAADAAGHSIEVICVDPFPTAYLTRLADRGRVRLVPERAQDVAQDVLVDVGRDGLLFVDSTHAVSPDSEVNRIVLEVLPRLGPGTWAHFHDITLPFNYQRGLMSNELFFSSESTLVHAFLVQNDTWRLALSLSMLHYRRASALQQLLPHYRPQLDDYGLRQDAGAGTHFPSAVYLQAMV